MRCILAAIHHDPEGRLRAQIERVTPALAGIFGGLAVMATDATPAESVAPLVDAGALLQFTPSVGHLLLGRARRGGVALGLTLGAEHMLFCDLDRALHWAEREPDELRRVAAALTEYDFTVLGRTPRAFASHPRTQRDTEVIANHVFALVSGRAWDITAAARGLSRRAAEAIVAGCAEDGVGTDGAWPLFLERAGGFRLGYIVTEGLEFETADRYGDAVAAAGGYEAWLAQLDADPRGWAQRLAIAQSEVEGLLPYVPS